jgi:hypothetical protein
MWRRRKKQKADDCAVPIKRRGGAPLCTRARAIRCRGAPLCTRAKNSARPDAHAASAQIASVHSHRGKTKKVCRFLLPAVGRKKSLVLTRRSTVDRAREENSSRRYARAANRVSKLTPSRRTLYSDVLFPKRRLPQKTIGTKKRRNLSKKNNNPKEKSRDRTSSQRRPKVKSRVSSGA